MANEVWQHVKNDDIVALSSSKTMLKTRFDSKGKDDWKSLDAFLFAVDQKKYDFALEILGIGANPASQTAASQGCSYSSKSNALHILGYLQHDASWIPRFIKKGVPIDALDSSNKTPEDISLEQKNYLAAFYFQSDEERKKPEVIYDYFLKSCGTQDHRQIIGFLDKFGDEITAKLEPSQPLYGYIDYNCEGWSEIMDYFETMKVKPNAAFSNGWTALTYAAEVGNLDACDRLIELGAGIDLALRGVDKNEHAKTYNILMQLKSEQFDNVTWVTNANDIAQHISVLPNGNEKHRMFDFSDKQIYTTILILRNGQYISNTFSPEPFDAQPDLVDAAKAQLDQDKKTHKRKQAAQKYGGLNPKNI